MKARLEQSLLFLPLLVVLVLQSGCCTYSMWDDGMFDASKQPAPNPHLKLFQAQRQDDFLVVYKEYSERKESIRWRAYWLNVNEDKILTKHPPEFVDAHLATNLVSVPVFDPLQTNNFASQELYAIYGINKQSFTLFSGTNLPVLHYLPVYDDGWGKIERTALTPLTVTADCVIAAGAVAVVAAVIYAGGSPPCY